MRAVTNNHQVMNSNVTTNEPIELKTHICGNMCVRDAFLVFKNGNHEHMREIKLENVPECKEESTLSF